MTVSIETTTLSSVITGWGLNETTCSRRSTISRIRSTNGTTIASPALSVREYRPNRSTTPARAWGTMRIVRARVMNTRAVTMRGTINVATPDLLLVDEGRCALDLDDVDPRSGLDHLIVDERARRPLLATDAHPASVDIHALQDEGLRADERGRTGAKGRRHPQVAPGQRAEKRDGCDRRDREDEELAHDADAEQGEQAGEHGRNGHRTEEEEAGREDFSDSERGSRNCPKK